MVLLLENLWSVVLWLVLLLRMHLLLVRQLKGKYVNKCTTSFYNLRQNTFIWQKCLIFTRFLSFSCDLGESFNSESTQHKSAKFVLGPSCFSDRTQMQRDFRFLIILSN